ncbi:hypothetical protein SKAU_G00418830 [Synaphobranchus kaupii]|uniref:Uncharacterized protein n=1 Tax=Synaphobranchus kaupii TaxID=118154 RepID=A0A9Q1IAX5_SYNKA|nr:hypothetical protein SKAU_G00418830 [Synaphobranchus kaupii]
MLILWLLLGIHLPSMGVKADYCIKALPCVATQCFEIRGSEDAVCSSTHHKEVCSIEGTHIKLKCDAQLSCKCKEPELFPLAGRVEYPVKDQSSISMKNEFHPEEENNTHRINSSDLLVLLVLLFSLYFRFI